MKQIIRVEHTDGIGMFVDAKLRRSHTVDYILPSLFYRHYEFNDPNHDNLILQDDDFCAYKSIEQIQQWIYPQEFEVLFDHGYSVYLLEVSQWQEGRDNVLFKKEHIISKKNINQLFTLKQDV